MVENPLARPLQSNEPEQTPADAECTQVHGTRAAIYAIIFGLFLSIGIWSGRTAGIHMPARGPLAALSSVPSPPTPSTGQINLLVIGVDRLNAHDPRLESIWLLGYFPNQPNISLIPVYPSPSGLASSDINEIENGFSLNSNGQPSSELVKLLRRKRIWWNSYAVIDDFGMIEIIDHLGGIEVDGRLLNGALAVSSFPLPSEDAAAALKGQTQLLKGICNQTNLLSPSSDLRNVLNLIPDHVQTDVDIFQVIRDWREMVDDNRNFACEFPLLNASLP